MFKLLSYVLVLVLVGVGIYLVFTKSQTFFNPAVTPDKTVIRINSTTPAQPSTASEAATTAEEDLTALEKELSSLDDADAGFLQDLNSL